jgi:hypothetical protein
MVPINNHEDDGRSSSSSTCLPDGCHGDDAEEEAQEVDYSTVPPTPNVTRLLLSPCRGARYPLRSTPERLCSRGRAAAATTLTALSQGRGAARLAAAQTRGRVQSVATTGVQSVAISGVQLVAPTGNYSTILPRGVAGGGTTAAAAVVNIVQSVRY